VKRVLGERSCDRRSFSIQILDITVVMGIIWRENDRRWASCFGRKVLCPSVTNISDVWVLSLLTIWVAKEKISDEKGNEDTMDIFQSKANNDLREVWSVTIRNANVMWGMNLWWRSKSRPEGTLSISLKLQIRVRKNRERQKMSDSHYVEDWQNQWDKEEVLPAVHQYLGNKAVWSQQYRIPLAFNRKLFSIVKKLSNILSLNSTPEIDHLLAWFCREKDSVNHQWTRKRECIPRFHWISSLNDSFNIELLGFDHRWTALICSSTFLLIPFPISRYFAKITVKLHREMRCGHRNIVNPDYRPRLTRATIIQNEWKSMKTFNFSEWFFNFNSQSPWISFECFSYWYDWLNVARRRRGRRSNLRFDCFLQNTDHVLFCFVLFWFRHSKGSKPIWMQQ
jgi:hypothetical protein